MRLAGARLAMAHLARVAAALAAGVLGASDALSRAPVASAPASAGAVPELAFPASLAPGPALLCKASRAAAHQAARASGATRDAAATISPAVEATRAAARPKASGSRRRHCAPQGSCANIRRASSESTAGSRLGAPTPAGRGGPSDAASVRVVSTRGCQPPASAKTRRASGSSCAKGTSTIASRSATPSISAQRMVQRAIRSHASPAVGVELSAASSRCLRAIVAIGMSGSSCPAAEELCGRIIVPFEPGLAVAALSSISGAGTRIST